jgi:hypothetical protein
MNLRQMYFSLLALLLQLPVLAYADGLVPCGRDGQDACQMCHTVQLVNGVTAWLVGILSIAAAIMFVIAGFRLVTANGNPSVMQDAKNTITNVAIGFAIVLAAWLLIDLMMKTLLGGGSVAAGPWNQIACIDQPNSTVKEGNLGFFRAQEYGTCSSVDDCAAQVQACSSRPGGSGVITGTSGNMRVTCSFTTTASGAGSGAGLVSSGGRGEAQCAPSNPNCSVDLLISLGLTPTQANIMSCVAMTENAGGSVGCSGTGPCGTFQITMTNWRNYTEGARAPFPECSAARFGGNISSAQNNSTCNAKIMTAMVRASGYQPWTGANTNPNDNIRDGPWNPYARGCVNTHGNASDSTPRGF